MGKRSRKRSTGPLRPPETAPAPRPVPRRTGRRSRIDRIVERAEERPKPPWHPFPLIELSVLIGIVLLVYGLINSDTSRGRLAAVCGLALASLAGLDTAIRDHFGGFRSHSALLAALPTVLAGVLLALLKVAPVILLIAVVGVYGIAFWSFRGAFKRRTGVGFKV